MKRVGLAHREWPGPILTTLLLLTAHLDIFLRHVALHHCMVVYVMCWDGKGPTKQLYFLQA